MTVLSPLDLSPVTDDDAAMFVGVATDPDGRALIGLDAAALDALDALLDALPLPHDLVEDGVSPAAADLASALKAAISAHLRPALYR